MKVEIDGKSITQQFILDVKVVNLGQWRWRVKIAMWLIQLAGWIAWMDVVFTSEKSRGTHLYSCSKCGRDTIGELPNSGEDLIVSCHHCHRQELVRLKMDGQPTYVLENELTCGLGCHIQEPYGFVPEADCPVHDRI